MFISIRHNVHGWKIETDRYNFVETDTDIFEFFSPIFSQLSIFDIRPVIMMNLYKLLVL